MSKYKTESRCMICSRIKQVRYIDLYVQGSEGLLTCHDCEMLVVQYILTLKGVAMRARRDYVLERNKNE